MKVIHTAMQGLYVVQGQSINDDRGSFNRLFCQHSLQQADINTSIVQANYSHTQKRGAIRGLHFQLSPAMETKMVRCVEGEVFDVAVDLRKGSPTFLHWHGQILSPESNTMMVIPEGFAHGFQTLTEDAKMLYFHTQFYSKEHERGVRFDDPLLNIQWPLSCSEISSRDQSHSLLNDGFTGISNEVS